MNRFRLLVVGLLAATWALPGCVAVVAGAAAAGTIQYVRNEASRDYAATVEATWAAALQVLQERGLPVDPAAPVGPSGGTLDVGDVHLEVFARGTDRTRVRVRVGTFDTNTNREEARLILDGVAERLGA